MPNRKLVRRALFSLVALSLSFGAQASADTMLTEYLVPPGSRPHDVAPAPGGGVWFTAQGAGSLGLLDPTNGHVDMINLGSGSRPHGVIVGPDGAPWITDGGLNAIVRVDPRTHEPQRYPLPQGSRDADLNTAAFDAAGTLWFTGEAGIYGRLSPASGRVDVFEAPDGPSPYGISFCADGNVYFASLAASYLGRIDRVTAKVSVLKPPGPPQGTRRVWADRRGVLWVTGWSSGNLLRYDPAAVTWRTYRLPGDHPRPYAVYADERGEIWVSDFAANAILKFDPGSERFMSLSLPTANASIRQLAGRPGEVWGAESGADKLVVVRIGNE